MTIELTSLAVAFALLLGIPTGILSATRRDQAIDNVTRVGTLLGLSVPVFWQGTMLILFFSIYLRWMPPLMWVDFFADPRRNLTIMLLPALCLGTASAANIARTTRVCMLDVLRSEYIRTAAAKGLTGRLVILKHALKNALIPIVTVAGLQVGILLGGTVVVEEVFTLPGIGRLVLWSIYQRDYPLTQIDHSVHRGDVHDHQPGRRRAVRLPRPPHPLQQLTAGDRHASLGALRAGQAAVGGGTGAGASAYG